MIQHPSIKMKFLLTLFLLTLAASEIIAFKLQHDQEGYQKENFDRKHLLNRHDPYKHFNQGKDAIKHSRTFKETGKVREFDVDFRRLKDDKLEHSIPVKDFKVESFPASSIKHRMIRPKQYFVDKERFEQRQTHEDFKLPMKHDDLKMEKPHYENVVRRPSHNFEPFPKHHKSTNFQHNKLEDANRKLYGFRKSLQDEEFKSEVHQFEERADQLRRGDKLMQEGFNKIDGKTFKKPFSGVQKEFNDLEGNMDYLKNKEQSLVQADYFPENNERFEAESEKLMHGNEIMGNGFEHMESVEMSPRFNNLKGEFDHLSDNRAKLDDSENFMTGMNLDDGFGHLEKEGNGVFSAKGIMDNQFMSLQDSDLNRKYDSLESEFDAPLTSGYGDHMTGSDFKKGFGFMNNHVGKLGGNNMFMNGGSGLMNFPSFGM